MNINTNINILGGLPDFNMITYVTKASLFNLEYENLPPGQFSLKTSKAVKRFQKAILETFATFNNSDVEKLAGDVIRNEDISRDSLVLLFWNAALNDDLFRYINSNVFFPAFYSGRVSIKQNEVEACLRDLKERESQLKKWAEYTVYKVASKYLTLLKKFNLMEGSMNKTIVHPYLNDKMFILFVYWITAIESKSNMLESDWLKYSFCEKSVFIERLMQKKFAKYFHLNYTGDKLNIETTVLYENIYNAIK